MRKFVLTFLIIITTLNLSAQIEKGKFIISVDGNYIKTNTENGVKTNQIATQEKHLSTGTSVGYFLTKRIVAGVGLDYFQSKESRMNNLQINNSFQKEIMNVKSKAWMPNIYLGYYYPILNRFYLNTSLKFSYSKINSEYNTLVAGTTYVLPSDDLTSGSGGTYVLGYQDNSKTDFFSTKILPELTYFISSRFSLSLGLGGIEYSMTDWKTDNSNWTINFNPVSWKFGIKIAL